MTCAICVRLNERYVDLDNQLDNTWLGFTEALSKYQKLSDDSMRHQKELLNENDAYLQHILTLKGETEIVKWITNKPPNPPAKHVYFPIESILKKLLDQAIKLDKIK